MKLDDLKLLASQHPYPMSQAGLADFQDHLRQLGLDPDHLYQELEMSDRNIQVHQDTSWPGAVSALHSHAFYEVLCCRSNCGAEYLVGAERFRLQKGDIVFVPPGVSHRPMLPEGMEEPYIRDVLWFSTDFVTLAERIFPNLTIPRTQHRGLLRTAGTPWEPLGDLLHSAVEETERQGTGWELAVMGIVMQFMARLKRAFLDESVSMPAEKPELLDQAMAWVEANLTQRITLEDMAKQLFVSKSTLSQTFHYKLGVSVHRYLTQRRLIAAKTKILEGVSLEEVGAMVGFSDYSGFYRAFRQEYGISPRQFRKLQGDNRN